MLPTIELLSEWKLEAEFRNIGIRYLTNLIESNLHRRSSTWEIHMCLVVDGEANDGGEVCLRLVGEQRKDEPFPIEPFPVVVELKYRGNTESSLCVVVGNVRNTDLA